MSNNKKPTVPSYRLHKASGQAVVTLEARDHYLGKHGTPESRSAYERLVSSYLANGRKLPRPPSPAGYTVAQLADEFLTWAEAYYRLPDGRVSRSVENLKNALRPMLELFFDVPAAEFGPRSLTLFRQRLIDSNLSRKVVNERVGIVRRAFRWAAQEERIPPEQYHRLLAVDGLRRGRCGARETDPVQCVPVQHVEAAVPFLSPQGRAMVQLQLWTGMRPGEVVILRLS